MTVTVKKLKVRKLPCCENKSRITVVFDIEEEDSEWHDYLEKNIKDNTWILDHYASFRAWDWSYNLRLFGDSLYETGRCIKENDRLKMAQKYGSRAMYLGKRLCKIADHEEVPSHLDTTRYFEKVKFNWVGSGQFMDGEELLQMETEYTTGNYMGMGRKEYYDKMYKITHNKSQEMEKEYYNQAMEDLTKYLRYFWD